MALPYPVLFAGRVLPNLILDFKNGKVGNIEIESDNPDDLNWVKAILDADEDASEVGEIALATNRAFSGPMLNPMYIEKVGGSFHLALGDAYRGLYDGKEVKYDNGVKSNNHIDLTCMMLKQYGGGRVIVDDKILVQEDGEFLDPRLSVLNSVQAGKKGIVDIR